MAADEPTATTGDSGCPIAAESATVGLWRSGDLLGRGALGVAAAVIWLASDLARFVTGTTVHVDGGTWAAGGWRRVVADDSYML